MRDHSALFNEIYEKEKWGKGQGSGTGSCPDYCKRYIEFLKKHLNAMTKPCRVLDLGCGDRRIYRDLNWEELSGVTYIGVDVAAPVNPPIQWDFQRDIRGLFQEIGPVDIVLLKDVIMHWTDEEVEEFMQELLQCDFKELILCNSWKYNRKPEKNELPRTLDPRYSWAPISVFKEPLNKFPFQFLFNFRFKQVALLRK